MKADYEAKGEPVPTAVADFLATEEKFRADCKLWISRLAEGAA